MIQNSPVGKFDCCSFISVVLSVDEFFSNRQFSSSLGMHEIAMDESLMATLPLTLPGVHRSDDCQNDDCRP